LRGFDSSWFFNYGWHGFASTEPQMNTDLHRFFWLLLICVSSV
jgi:hypothetical protein